MEFLHSAYAIYPLAFAGIFGLIWGANLLVRGSSSIARRSGIPEIVIGLTIVAIGTSLPELTVTLIAAIQGSTELAIGNVIGSNIVNILLILGCAATMTRIQVTRNTTWKEIPMALLAAVVLGIMLNERDIDGAITCMLSHSDGLILLGFGAIFMAYILSVAKQGNGVPSQPESTMPTGKAVGAIILGAACLFLGGKFLVDGAVAFATMLGASEGLIGKTVVAIGTSLPELVTSVIAARQGKADLAVGNALGSNIINVFMILGIGSTIRVMPFSGNNIDVYVMIGATLILFLAMFTGKKYELNRKHGLLFLTLYVGYLIYSINAG